MKWFSNLKIAAKLITGFIIVAMIAGIVGVIGLINLENITEADRLLYEENTLGLNYGGNAAIHYQRIRFYTVKMMLFKDAAQQEDCVANIRDNAAKVEEFLRLYEGGIISDTDRDLFNTMKTQWEKYITYIENIIELVHSGETEQAMDMVFGVAASAGETLQSTFEEIFRYNSSEGEARSKSNTELASSATFIMVVVIIAGILIAVGLGIFIAQNISRPLQKMVMAADKLALGDVNVNVDADTRDEVGNLASSFKKMIENIRNQAMAAEKIAAGDMTVFVDIRSENDLLGRKLYEIVETNNEVLGNIAIAAEQVASGARQVSDSSMALSQGAAEQASAIEQLTASLEEISSQTDLNARNANQANDLAEAAKNYAEQGNRQMQEMLRAMEEINESSANISKIIKVIDEIAFQTNILALNAAVEAARAGQHGKGFAVVAEEVRNLAARSANAAKETTDLIEGSIKKTEAGTRIANETAKALNEIVAGITRAASLVNDIAIASNEQATGIAQINQGVMQISQVVQNNSATAEESASASEELSSQAELLRESVGRFKLRKNSSSSEKQDILNPEVIRLIEDMSEKKKSRPARAKGAQAGSAPKVKIDLSDKEFGKY